MRSLASHIANSWHATLLLCCTQCLPGRWPTQVDIPLCQSVLMGAFELARGITMHEAALGMDPTCVPPACTACLHAHLFHGCIILTAFTLTCTCSCCVSHACALTPPLSPTHTRPPSHTFLSHALTHTVTGRPSLWKTWPSGWARCRLSLRPWTGCSAPPWAACASRRAGVSARSTSQVSAVPESLPPLGHDQPMIASNDSLDRMRMPPASTLEAPPLEAPLTSLRPHMHSLHRHRLPLLQQRAHPGGAAQPRHHTCGHRLPGPG